MKVKNRKNFIPMMYFYNSENTLGKAGLKILSFWIKYLKDNNLDENIDTLTKTISNLEFYECPHNNFKNVQRRNAKFPYEIQYEFSYCRNCGLIED